MIYKPNSCSPFQTTTDLTDLPFFLECQIDSSNIQVRGYSIKILNSDNVLIFPYRENPEQYTLDINDITFIPGTKGLLRYTEKSKNFQNKDLSSYTNLNTGYNGSDLVIPFIVDTFPSNNTVNRNQLKLEIDEETGEITITDKAGNEYQDKLFNGGSYKWIITLYELELNTDAETKADNEYAIPTEGKYYDMVLTTGTVLGSNYKRIQSYKSDNIFADYYIQLGNYVNSAFNTVGTRVKIDSYDESFGYIYPVTGDDGFSEDLVTSTQAKHFKIYELNNNTTSLSEKNKVDYVYCKSDIFNGGTWTSLTTTEGNSFLTQTYTLTESIKNDSSDAFHPFKDDLDIVCVSGQTRVAFINNIGSDTTHPSGYEGGYLDGTTARRLDNQYYLVNLSPLNGIYIPIWSKSSDTQASVRWSRAPDADTIGELLNKTVCVVSGAWGGKNLTFATLEPDEYDPEYITSWNEVQIDKAKGSVGIVKNTDGTYEKAVDVNDKNSSSSLPSTIGEIFYNVPCDTTTGTAGKLYLRPFVGLESGMWWQEIDGTMDKNALRHFIIKDIDTEYWYVTYDKCYKGSGSTTEGDDSTFVIDTTRYQIKSFFRTSDENPFSFEADPEFNIKIKELGYDTALEPPENSEYLELTKSRNIYCYVDDYEQENNISWQNFEWLLYDSDGNVIDSSGLIYDGRIEYTFYGLAGVDQGGSPKIFTVALILNTYSGQSYEKTQELRTQFEENTLNDYPIGVDFDCDLTAVTLDMVPNSVIVPNDYDDDGTRDASDGQLILSDGIEYHKVYPTAETEFINQIEYTELCDTDITETLQLESEHIIKSKTYEGNLIELKDTDNGYPKLSITLSHMTKDDGGDIVLNDDRNKMLAEYTDIYNQVQKPYNVLLIIDDDIKEDIGGDNESEWYRKPEDMIYVSEWQPINLDITDYKDKTAYLPLSLGEGKDSLESTVVSQYRNINGLFNLYSATDSDSPLIIKEPLFAESDYNIAFAMNMYAINAEGKPTEITVSDGDYCIPGAFVPVMFSDYEFETTIKCMLYGQKSNGDKVYQEKNVCKAYGIWTWVDTINNSDEEKIWYDGDALYYKETETEKVGYISLNGKEKVIDEIANYPQADYDTSGWQLQKQISNIPERAVGYNKKITIAAQLDDDLRPIYNDVNSVTNVDESDYYEGNTAQVCNIDTSSGVRQLIAWWSEVSE